MNRASNLKLDSYLQTQEALSQNVSIYESNVNIKGQVDQFAFDLECLLKLKEEADQSIKWLIDEKNTIKKALELKLYSFSNALVCYANSVCDSEILEKAYVSKKHLKWLSELDLIDYYKQSIDIAKEHVTALEPFGINKAIITDAEKDCKAFEQKRFMLLALKEEKANAKSEYRMLQKKINQLLNGKLDHSIENLRSLHPDFVKYYFATRQKSKEIQHHFDVLGYLKDKATGEPIALGKVWVEGLDLSTHITAKGSFRFKDFPEGEHQLFVENINYKSLCVPIRRYKSEQSKMYLEMEAIALEAETSV
ncbi:carboxypeptidase-like regulatory domain-containing protein [Marinifilum flexuosum]|uniref:carboxypeptidase-like regulatory domain-containing protein n=1 Tax=Marinifilum flexuosum TaxID=1117708 RepID=UPI0024951C04|nr:carboxypeptidase-like regulatory domain-containing protein [Marinifilum flexuosum]